MKSQEIEEAKRLINQRIRDVGKLPYDKELKGFSVKAEKVKREAYVSGLTTSMGILEQVQKN
jgi:hypothetical protein